MINRPWKTGKFLISAGLKPLEDRAVFESEAESAKYLKNKSLTRQENLLKCYPLPIGLSEDEIQLIASFLRVRISKDLPHLQLDQEIENARDEIDRIVCHVPEDFAVWKLENHEDWMALIHLCAPNHWDARKKIGKSFLESHDPIPHIDPISHCAHKIFHQIQNRGAMERFAWGVATDQRLNHHPEPPPGEDPVEWRGRSFDPYRPLLYIRRERQVLIPIAPELIGFTIKTTFINVKDLSAEDLALVHQSIKSMDEDVLKYKGLHTDQKAILKWLEELAIASMSIANLPPHAARQVEQFL